MAAKKFIEASGETLVTITHLNSTVTSIGKAQLLVHEDNFTQAVGASKTYNLATILGTNASKYDMTKIKVTAEVMDTVVGSVTLGYWIAADAVTTVGTKTTGAAIVVNNYDAAVQLRVRIYTTLI